MRIHRLFYLRFQRYFPAFLLLFVAFMLGSVAGVMFTVSEVGKSVATFDAQYSCTPR